MDPLFLAEAPFFVYINPPTSITIKGRWINLFRGRWKIMSCGRWDVLLFLHEQLLICFHEKQKTWQLIGYWDDVRLESDSFLVSIFEEIDNFRYLVLTLLDYLRKSEFEDDNLNLERYSSGSEARKRPDYTNDFMTETLQNTIYSACWQASLTYWTMTQMMTK